MDDLRHGRLGLAHVEDSANDLQTRVCTSTPASSPGLSCEGSGPINETFPFSASGGSSMFGWAAGGGIDYKWQIDAGSAVVFGVKYLHYGFGSNSLVLNDNLSGPSGVPTVLGNSVGLNTDQKVDVVTGRISYLFSIH